MALNQDFKEFIQSLNDNGVRYLVVGGYAVAQHGHPRYTKDIDIWIEMSKENAAKKEQSMFNTVKPMLGSIQWLGGQDFCPDTLYMDSEPLEELTRT